MNLLSSKGRNNLYAVTRIESCQDLPANGFQIFWKRPKQMARESPSANDAVHISRALVMELKEPGASPELMLRLKEESNPKARIRSLEPRETLMMIEEP